MKKGGRVSSFCLRFRGREILSCVTDFGGAHIDSQKKSKSNLAAGRARNEHNDKRKEPEGPPVVFGVMAFWLLSVVFIWASQYKRHTKMS